MTAHSTRSPSGGSENGVITNIIKPLILLEKKILYAKQISIKFFLCGNLRLLNNSELLMVKMTSARGDQV